MTKSTARPVEAEEFLTALQELSPHALTACPEWNVHDIGAHLAGIYEEVTRHVQAYSAGTPLKSTRSFEEREAPFRELSPAELLRTVDREEDRMRREIRAVIDEEPDATLWWTGRWMRVDAFLSHLRSECAIHRWDMYGEDDVSMRLLRQFDLFKHAVTNIGAKPLCARGIDKYGTELSGLSARVRTDGLPDLRIDVTDSVPTMDLVDPADEATVSGDQAARLLLLWGRSPATPSTRLQGCGSTNDVLRLRRLLSGY
ncbi:hypothetical protein A5641_26585 [Mycobacterium sp. 1554424.7]|nr:hypothetical protein A5641_26585 [Mycobacterium sp. 1554424.7]